MFAQKIETLQLSAKDFGYFQAKILEIAGISLSNAKLDLVQSRLRSHILSLGMSTFSAYRDHLENLKSADPEWQVFINLLTTNKTDWFRESQHFNILAQSVLPQWLKLGKKRLKVWCAASSTGEEPYTLGLVLDSELRNTNVTFDILATDIDTDVLNVARKGVYPIDRLYQIPEHYHREGFDFGKGDIASWIRVKKRIKDCIRFEQFNLTDATYPWRGEFDLVFCRNVLIYFSPTTTQQVIQNTFGATCEDALLFIAHSESLQSIRTSWTYVKPSIYRKGKRL